MPARLRASLRKVRFYKEKFPMKFFEAARKVFSFDEGEREKPYKDSKGYWTIGIGHLIGSNLTELKLSKEVIDLMFQEDLAIAIADARIVVGNSFFDSLLPARQMALISMLYTLGRNKFLMFDETIEAMKEYNWDKVASNILKSKWASDVDPRKRVGVGRDDRIAYMFKTGEFHEDYKID